MEALSKFNGYLESEKKACLMEATALAKDSRQDEANLMKVRANIFDIFSAVCRQAEQRFAEDPVSFIQGKMETIPEGWRKALAEAQTHADSGQVAVETVKLDTIAKLRKVFSALLEAKK